jgi:V/A-type H+-transporting ATPase subunit I
MRNEEKFSLIQGFCPEQEVPKIISLAKKNNLGYLIETPSQDEEPPTLIKNPKWLTMVNPIFEFINTLPGYAEFDISAVFLLFFSIFFAMIVGDAGYGLLFFMATFFIRKKFKNIPPQPFHLMYVLSIATIVWGAISGTWFSFEQIAKLPVINSLVINKVNSFAKESQLFVMYLCFVIGVVHLTIGHIMKYIREINSVNSLTQLGWISILWGLFFLAGTLILNKPFPVFAKYLLIVGVTTVLIFSNFQKNIIKGIALSFVDTFLGCTGGFSDIISYLRLFAVGSASVAIASSFNTMAIGGGTSNVIGGIIAAFIIFFAHALNITLSFLAVIVHGLRLNMLEFSGHLGMQWSGHKYEPFREE